MARPRTKEDAKSENNRERQARFQRRKKQTKEYKPYMVNGELDILAWLNSPDMKIKMAEFISGGLEGRRTNSQFMKTVLEVVGIYKNKQEVDHKVEFTVNDRRQVYEDFIRELDRERKDSRICPLCKRREEICEEPCLLTESEGSVVNV